MDDEKTNTDEPTLESVTAELETWKGHARDWETKAKANLTELANVQTELETLKSAAADLDTVKTELSNAQAERTRFSIALEYGLSLEDAKLLQGDEATQRALAERLKKPAGMSPNPHQGKGESNKSMTGIEAFTALFEG